jgi:diacylglycerol kinase (ATP)
MAEKIYVILNAFGGRLGEQAKVALIGQAMQTAGLDYHLELTQYAGHATELARQAILEGWPIVAAAGGDGTIHEVINGFMLAAEKDLAATFAIIPLGTANDLADGLQLPQDAAAACQRIAAGNTRLIDIGLVNGRYFANNSAVGLEPVVTINHEQMRRVKGNLRYLLAAFKSIVQARPWQMRMIWDEGSYEGPVTLVSVGNGRRSGGLFYMTPQAEMDDGLLDFVFAGGLTRWQILTFLPKTLKGTHINDPLVTYLKTRSLTITSSPSTPIHADGEVIEREALEINYSILANKLRIIV